MRITSTILIAAIALLTSCGSDSKTTPKGYEFKVVKSGDGKTVQPGEVIILDMVIVDENDSAWYDNRLGDYPEMIKIGDVSKMEIERGISEAFRMLSKGDSILFPMRAKDIFLFMWKMDVPQGVDPNSYFTYHIKCRDVFNEADALEFSHSRDSIHEINERVRLAAEEEERRQTEAELEEYNKIQLGKDTVIIDNYLKSKNVKVKHLASGMRYIVKAHGEGPNAVKGDVVSMKYTGQLLDGKEFDAGEFTFKVGNDDVIKGWDLIAMNMNKGTTLTLFIPSTLAYGHSGRAPVIGPDAILVFDLELLSIN